MIFVAPRPVVGQGWGAGQTAGRLPRFSSPDVRTSPRSVLGAGLVLWVREEPASNRGACRVDIQAGTGMSSWKVSLASLGSSAYGLESTGPAGPSPTGHTGGLPGGGCSPVCQHLLRPELRSLLGQ